MFIMFYYLGMKSVLLCLPDYKLSQTLNTYLANNNSFVQTTHLLNSSYDRLKEKAFDIAIVGSELHDGSGLELIDYLHHYHFACRSIFVTNNLSYQSRIEAYRSGADEILQLPLHPKEFQLRFEMLTRRRKLKDINVLPINASVSYFPEEGLIKFPSEKVQLRRRENQILNYLIENKNRVVNKEELLRWVWHDSEKATPITLEVYIRRVRIHLGELSGRLETVRGFGYRFRE